MNYLILHVFYITLLLIIFKILYRPEYTPSFTTPPDYSHWSNNELWEHVGNLNQTFKPYVNKTIFAFTHILLSHTH